jgi:cytochrome c oxidase cbb3-type subunit 1
MSTLVATDAAGVARPLAPGVEPEGDTTAQDHGLPRFFFAAAAALCIAAIHGLIMRLPPVAEWIRGADYGGHLITNLALTHITIVGAGTISLTGLTYYILPRLTRRPLYSQNLTNVSFWFTIIGVFGFYVAMTLIGAYEGAMVHAGWTYEDARNWMGAWHKAPMAITAAIMGIGYWTFVFNVYASAKRGGEFRKANPTAGAPAYDWLLAQFCVVAATGLLIGTVQGVLQVLPWSLDWLRAAGEAGHLIDPLSHAHINLVGGVSIGMMALLYFFLPRMLNRPIYSYKLAVFSYYTVLVGVFGFWLVNILLGFWEGSMVVQQHMDYEDVLAQVGLWHSIPQAGTATIMGIGFWAFIANILLTLRRGAAPDAPPDRWLAGFIGFSVTALLLGTIQGVIQILEPVEHWLEGAPGTGWMITPYAHAQLNMIGFAILGLATLSTFALPRVTGRPLFSAGFARRTLTLLAGGIAASYVIYLGMGLLESIRLHQLLDASGVDFEAGMNGLAQGETGVPQVVQARDAVGGDLVHYGLMVAVAIVIGMAYFAFMRHIALSIGMPVVRQYFRDLVARIGQGLYNSSRPQASALPANPAEAPRRALIAGFIETMGGWLGFMGMGWLTSGRGFIGMLVLALWAALYWSFLFILLAVTLAGPEALVPVILTWFFLPLLSGYGAYRTYLTGAREQAARE